MRVVGEECFQLFILMHSCNFKMGFFVGLLAILFMVGSYEASYSDYGAGTFDVTHLLTDKERNETCQPPLSGYKWVLAQRKNDYGWGDQTHRAVIILALNDLKRLSGSDETSLIEHQLEVELARALIRNETTEPMLLSDLALFIHALIVTGRDPRNFYDMDLVEILKDRLDRCSVHGASEVNVFALLVLSDARAIETKHILILRDLLHNENTRKQRELKAISLHALACATDETQFRQYSDLVSEAANDLGQSQNPDGSFGNVYTTALVMQALTASPHNRWNENAARDFLVRKKEENVNMVSTYYIERALNAHKLPCLKALYNITSQREGDLPLVHDIQRWPLHYYVQYSLRVGEHPDVYHTIAMKVPENSTFFDIMRFAEAEDRKFRFSWHLDESNDPIIYSLSGIPNNAEESLYWRLTVETEVDHNRHTSKKTEFVESPKQLVPEPNSHLIYCFMDAFKQIEL